MASRGRTPWWEDLIVFLITSIRGGLAREAKFFGKAAKMVHRSGKRRLPGVGRRAYAGARWVGKKSGWLPRDGWNGERFRDFLREIREEARQNPGETTIVDFFTGKRHPLFEVDNVLGHHAVDDGWSVDWAQRPHTSWHPDEKATPGSRDHQSWQQMWIKEFGRVPEWDLPVHREPTRRLHWWQPQHRDVAATFTQDVDQDLGQWRKPQKASPHAGNWGPWIDPEPPGAQDPPYKPRQPLDPPLVIIPPYTPTTPKSKITKGSLAMTAANLENLQDLEVDLDNFKEAVPAWIDQVAAALTGVVNQLNGIAETAQSRQLPDAAQRGFTDAAEMIAEAQQRLSGVSGEVSSQYDAYQTPTSR